MKKFDIRITFHDLDHVINNHNSDEGDAHIKHNGRWYTITMHHITNEASMSFDPVKFNYYEFDIPSIVYRVMLGMLH